MAGSKNAGGKSGAREAAKPAKTESRKPSASRPPARPPAKPVKPAPRPAKSGGSAVARPMARTIAKPVVKAPVSAGSPFNVGELREWRQLLLERRAEIATDISHLERDAMEAEDGHTTPNHIAERGSDAEMQDMSLGLAGEEQVVLWQIDRAIRKIDTGEPLAFGVCEHTRQPISKNRLQLIPWTPLSIEGATYAEEQGLSLEDVLVDG